MAELTIDRLDSWKEIAEYLGRDIRTVIRWEKEKGLPVRRVPGGKRQAVYAYKSEIDQWMLGLAGGPKAEALAEGPPAGVARAGSWRLWLRIALPIAGAALVLIVAGLLWMERPPSAAAGPLPLARPLQFSRADYDAASPRGLVAGDFNGDKRLDLAFTESSQGRMVVLLGDGFGAFPQRIVTPTALESPERLAASDFNGDGKLDVALSSYFGGNEIEVLLGDGRGGFRTHARYDVGGRSRWIAAGDLNRDGIADLAVAASNAEKIIIFFGKGDGRFQESARYAAERDVATIVLVDLNGDDALDIVADDYRSGTGQYISVYRNAGNGTFPERERFAAPPAPLGLAVADLNGDGKLDIVASNFLLKVSVLLGTGPGKFSEARNFDAGRCNGFVDVADFDRDGNVDLVVTGSHTNSASVLLGDGTGNFARGQDVPTGAYPDGAVIADFNDDRKPDFAVLNTNGDSISVHLNRAAEISASRGWLARLFSSRSK